MKKITNVEKIENAKSNLQMSRREFIGNFGKFVGLAALTHFTLIGNLRAHEVRESDLKTTSNEGEDFETRAQCSAVQTNNCPGDRHTCTDIDKHSCVNKFSCGIFSCNPVNSNTSLTPCSPSHHFAE